MMSTDDLHRWARAEARLAHVRRLLEETVDDALLVEELRLSGTVAAFELVALLERAAGQVRDARWN